MYNRRRYFLWLTILYLGIVLGLLVHTSTMLTTTTSTQDDRPPLGVVVFGVDELESNADYRDGQAERSATFATSS